MTELQINTIIEKLTNIEASVQVLFTVGLCALAGAAALVVIFLFWKVIDNFLSF